MTPTDLHVVTAPQLDPRLGRQVVHDPRSRGFALAPKVDPATWRTRTVRIYDPKPNPNQTHGNCTGCSKAIQFNSVGNRKAGRVLDMSDADTIYALATTLDPWPGSWNVDGTGEDTGSSGLAAAQAAQKLGLGGEYRWLFGGADEAVQAIVGGAAVSVGTWWYEGGFDPKPEPGGGVRIEMTGRKVGGHQWTLHRYDKRRDLVGGLCWWGDMSDFWIRRSHLADLLADDGDAHIQQAIVS